MRELIKAPQDCSQEELLLFEKFVMEGGEVQSQGLSGRIKLADRLIFIHLNDGCVAIGALKCPNAAYKKRVFQKSGVPNDESSYLYTSPKSRGQGVGSFLMKSVSKALNGNSCYATTRENNSIMHHLFEKASFLRLGEAYKSDQGDYYLGLFATKS